jgi:hypothetical protein
MQVEQLQARYLFIRRYIYNHSIIETGAALLYIAVRGSKFCVVLHRKPFQRAPLL